VEEKNHLFIQGRRGKGGLKTKGGGKKRKEVGRVTRFLQGNVFPKDGGHVPPWPKKRKGRKKEETITCPISVRKRELNPCVGSFIHTLNRLGAKRKEGEEEFLQSKAEKRKGRGASDQCRSPKRGRGKKGGEIVHSREGQKDLDLFSRISSSGRGKRVNIILGNPDRQGGGSEGGKEENEREHLVREEKESPLFQKGKRLAWIWRPL